MARFRPEATLIGLSPDEKVVRALRLSWGVDPMPVDVYESTDEMVWYAVEKAVQQGRISHGDTVLVLAGAILLEKTRRMLLAKVESQARGRVGVAAALVVPHDLLVRHVRRLCLRSSCQLRRTKKGYIVGLGRFDRFFHSRIEINLLHHIANRELHRVFHLA